MKNWVRRVQLCHTFLCCFTVPFFRVSLCSSHTFLLYQPCVIWAEYLFSDLVKTRTLSRSSVSECCSGPKNLWQEQLILVSSDLIFNVPVLRFYILKKFRILFKATYGYNNLYFAIFSLLSFSHRLWKTGVFADCGPNGLSHRGAVLLRPSHRLMLCRLLPGYSLINPNLYNWNLYDYQLIIKLEANWV